MYKEPLAWIDTIVIIIDLCFIWLNFQNGKNSFIAIMFGFAATLLVVSLYFMYGATQSKIRIEHLNVEIDHKISEIEHLIKKQN